jgi:hypothetical protein
MPRPDRPRTGIPTAAERGQIRAALARRGVPAATANAMVRAGLTWEQVQSELVSWQRTLPRAK